MVKGHRPDTPIRPRHPVVIGDHHPTDDPCAAPRTFEFDPEAAVAIGAAIHLVPMGDQVWIVASNSRVGTVSAAALPEIADCVASSWAFGGTIASIDVEGMAIAVVRGRPTR